MAPLLDPLLRDAGGLGQIDGLLRGLDVGVDEPADDLVELAPLVGLLDRRLGRLGDGVTHTDERLGQVVELRPISGLGHLMEGDRYTCDPDTECRERCEPAEAAGLLGEAGDAVLQEPEPLMRLHRLADEHAQPTAGYDRHGPEGGDLADHRLGAGRQVVEPVGHPAGHTTKGRERVDRPSTDAFDQVTELVLQPLQAAGERLALGLSEPADLLRQGLLHSGVAVGLVQGLVDRDAVLLQRADRTVERLADLHRRVR